MTSLKAGDVLSYSASSKQLGPDGFRTVQQSNNSLPALFARWPHLAQPFVDRTPLAIHCYPASVGSSDMVIFVDSYMNWRTACRALQLAAAQQFPVILTGQPLFLGEVIVRHHQHDFPLPASVLIFTGGYPMPRSLEDMLKNLATKKQSEIQIVHCYGAAEVDSACLVGIERTQDGEVIYHPRDNQIAITLKNNCLFLSFLGADGALVIDEFDTGDFAQSNNEGFVISNSPDKLDPEVYSIFNSWTDEDWARKTGYLGEHEGNITAQLREGEQPEADSELTYYQFAERFGTNWLKKPVWSFKKIID